MVLLNINDRVLSQKSNSSHNGLINNGLCVGWTCKASSEYDDTAISSNLTQPLHKSAGQYSVQSQEFEVLSIYHLNSSKPKAHDVIT